MKIFLMQHQMFISIIISDIITRLLHKFLNISKIILGMSFLLTSLLQRLITKIFYAARHRL